MHKSIEPTYDSRETGPRYWITTTIGGRTVEWRKPLDDPFVHCGIRIGMWDLLRGLFRRGLGVTVVVGADRDAMDDVLELDANQLVPFRTRGRDFKAGMHQALRDFAVDEELRDIVAAAEPGQDS